MLYQLLKAYVTLGLHLFFKKIKLVNTQKVPKTGPILFVANHQNALLDALLIATNNKRKIYFLTRADAFKNKIAKSFLSYLKMLPVYRIRDGFGSINQNEEVFKECFEILKNGNCLAIFPEGNHDLKRRLRPLSKGFTRIVFGAVDKYNDLNLRIVPIGINYTKHQSFRGGVSLYFGEPIDAQNYYSGNFIKDSQCLKEAVSTSLKELIVHVDDLANYDDKMEYLIRKKVDLLSPSDCNELLANEDNYFDPEIKIPFKEANNGSILANLVAILNFIPLLVWIQLQKKIKDPVMIGTFKFCYGVFLFPLIVLILATGIGLGFNIWIGVGYFIITLISSPILEDRSILKY